MLTNSSELDWFNRGIGCATYCHKAHKSCNSSSVRCQSHHQSFFGLLINRDSNNSEHEGGRNPWKLLLQSQDLSTTF